MTCDETLWPCWVCRENAVWVEDSARMSGTSGGLDGRLGQQIKTAPEPPVVPLRQQRVEFEGLADNTLRSVD